MPNDKKNNTGAGSVAKRAAFLCVFLFVLWFLLSGSFMALLLALGVASALFVVAIAVRMNIVDQETHPIHLNSSAVFYAFWLTWEIIKSNIDVARRILDPRLPISPNMVRVKVTQKSDLGRVSYANSITLTPGTVAVGVEEDSILVHALTKEAAETLAKGEMDRRVTKIEQAF